MVLGFPLNQPENKRVPNLKKSNTHIASQAPLPIVAGQVLHNLHSVVQAKFFCPKEGVSHVLPEFSRDAWPGRNKEALPQSGALPWSAVQPLGS